ncbi:MAG: tetratricopeptide repeat protein, partial [Longimicrobiales bacterium]
GVHGARSAQLRSRLYLQTGDIDRARNELIGAAPLLRGRDATGTIALATLLTRVSPRGGALVARVLTAQEPERAELVRAAADTARTLPADERAAVLDFLADVADAAGIPEDAAALRREIIETLPRTHEAPAALLTLARRVAADPESDEEARVLLEKLIVEYPRSALAPQARTELQRLQTH